MTDNPRMDKLWETLSGTLTHGLQDLAFVYANIAQSMSAIQERRDRMHAALSAGFANLEQALQVEQSETTRLKKRVHRLERSIRTPKAPRKKHAARKKK